MNDSKSNRSSRQNTGKAGLSIVDTRGHRKPGPKAKPAPFSAVGKRLSEVRGPASQAEFAATFGLSRSTLSRYEIGLQLLDSDFLLALGVQRDVNPTWILFGVGSPVLSLDSELRDTLPEIRGEVLSGMAEAITHAAETMVRSMGREMTPDARHDAHKAVLEYCTKLDEEGRALNISAIVSAIVDKVVRPS